MIGSTSFAYRGETLSFTLKDYGFKLHLPQDALPLDVTECSVRVRAALSGQFQFPDGAELVSGIYSIHSSHSFTRSVTVEIEHFSTIDTPEEAEELSFVISTEDQLPSQFRPLKDGIFPIHSQFGTIEVTHFSKYGVTRTKKSRRSARHEQVNQEQSYGPESRNLYKGYLLLFTEIDNDWEVTFSITPDTEIHSKVSYLSEFNIVCFNFDSPQNLLEKFPNRTVLEQPVLFKENKIELSIPKDGLNLDGGWTIQPLTVPIVSKLDYLL